MEIDILSFILFHDYKMVLPKLLYQISILYMHYLIEVFTPNEVSKSLSKAVIVLPDFICHHDSPFCQKARIILSGHIDNILGNTV